MVVFEDKDDDNEIDIEDTEEPNEIIERFMYYAFGMQWKGAWMYDEPVDSEENRYRYNGKEC